MDFRVYAEQKRKEAHKEILTDICMVVNNCANCFNCFPLHCVKLHKVTADSFYMEPYYSSKTNRELIDIASQNGYKAGFIMEGKEIAWIKFWK